MPKRKGTRSVNGHGPRPESFRELGTSTLQCRTLMHAWDPKYTTVEKLGRVKVYVLHLECTRCTTKRHDTIVAADGSREGRAYEYADGYLIGDLRSWGGRTEFGNNVRLELVGRLKVRKQ